MEIRQKFELRRLLAPEIRQSLKCLSLPLLDLKKLIEEELNDNPLLEEPQPSEIDTYNYPDTSIDKIQSNLDFCVSLITKKMSLQDILLRQLGMFVNTDEELRVGQEIIGNIDENGYLRVTLDEIANNLNLTKDKVENVLKLIQKFEPLGVGARTTSECLLIQLELANEKDPLIRKIVESHLEDVAKKNYSRIAKALKVKLDEIKPKILKILKLDPKPGRNYSLDEIQRIIPDIIIDEKDENLEIIINDENILPTLSINRTYRDMLKRDDLNPQTRNFLTIKLRRALELIRALSKRKTTLIKIMEIIVEIQQDAIKEDLSLLKPLTYQEVAQRLNIHESTVCRAIMNKYVKTPCGIVALKDLFSNCIIDQNGQSLSSTYIKRLIREIIEQEDKKYPLSDQEICRVLLKEKNIAISRRTLAKYREELKILSSTYRKEM